MSRVLFINLISAGFQLKITKFSTPWMTFVIVPNAGMTVEAKRNGVVYVGPICFDVSYFDADTSKLSAKTTVSITPEQDFDLVGLTKIKFSVSHLYQLHSKTNDYLMRLDF